MSLKHLVPLYVLLLSSTALAKVEADYSVHVTPVDANGNSVELLTALNGWSCSASTKIIYSDVQKDHSGKPTRVQRDYGASFSWNTVFGGKPSAHTTFRRDLTMAQPLLNVSVTESCSKTTTKPVLETTTDSEGNVTTQIVMRSDTDYASLTYSCAIDSFPSINGGERVYQCDNATQSGAWSLDALLLQTLRKKNFRVHMKATKGYESFAWSNCKSDKKNRHILHIEQGVGGHMGENDFEFKVQIQSPQGQEHITFNSLNGLLSEDIEYCMPEGVDPKDVKITVAATEKDAFFDNTYNPTQTNTFTLAQGQGNLKFERKSYSFHMFTPKHSEVSFNVRSIEEARNPAVSNAQSFNGSAYDSTRGAAIKGSGSTPEVKSVHTGG